MEEKELLAQANAILGDDMQALSVDNVNYALGHPYTIGPRHITYASDHNCGMLSEWVIRELEKKDGKGRCAHTGCYATYDEHKSDKVMFLQLKRNLTNDEAKVLLKQLVVLTEANGIDGFCFVDTAEKYRIN